LLDGRTSTSADTRTIYAFDSAAANKLKPFLWGNLTGTEQSYFGSANVATLSQGLSGANLTSASGENLVNFIRGQRGNEGQPTDASKYYRTRTHVLGDIVSAEAVYVKSPMFNYADSGYSGFKGSNSARQGMVYVAANDGMVHAFNADTGQEAWAYIPSIVMPNLYKLADSNYATKHQFFVDGTPTVGDAYIGGSWKTLLVGGFNAGGRGYYALDITDPANPKALWEFTHTNLGYTFGNPVITKLKDGTWTVMVTSGYNNISPGDGGGYLFVLNAETGAVINTIATGVGNTTTPSGLSRINAWTDDGMTDNTALRIYGGDLQGNLWRFDVNGDVGAGGFEAQQIAYFRGSGGGIQPITEKPELGDVNGAAVVFAGTGRFLGASDMGDSSQQTFYAVKDTLGSTSIGNARSNAGMVAQTLVNFTDSNGAAARKTSDNTVDFSSDVGWYIDLPDSGERSYTDPALALGTLVFTANVPNSDACTVGGYSWIYYVDYATGTSVSTSAEEVAGRRLGNALATRPVVVKLPNNSIVSLTRLSDSTTVTTNIPVGSGSTSTRRVSWRELISDE
jgi:type IV pilus assembly protein PilY1